MTYTFSFEKLHVWLDSKELVTEIYEVTRSFPDEEKFALTSQLRRASISIASNLAEGTSRKTKNDKAHFSTMSFSSLMEVLNQLIIANELNYISDSDYQNLRAQIEKISNKLNALRKSQLNE
jgi:four helix bundle protein